GEPYLLLLAPNEVERRSHRVRSMQRQAADKLQRHALPHGPSRHPRDCPSGGFDLALIPHPEIRQREALPVQTANDEERPDLGEHDAILTKHLAAQHFVHAEFLIEDDKQMLRMKAEPRPPLE